MLAIQAGSVFCTQLLVRAHRHAAQAVGILLLPFQVLLSIVKIGKSIIINHSHITITTNLLPQQLLTVAACMDTTSIAPLLVLLRACTAVLTATIHIDNSRITKRWQQKC